MRGFLTLAQLNDVPSSAVKDWLLICGFLIGLAGGILALFRRVPQPLRTSEDVKFATADGVQKLAKEVDDLRRELNEQRHTLTKELNTLEQRLGRAGEERAVAIHDRIEPMMAEIHQVKGTLTEVSRSVHEIAAQLRTPRRA